jgi:aspartyl-tRNA(Asn)/glutamyl-tRNA(Gln) amidotransferase subunit A
VDLLDRGVRTIAAAVRAGEASAVEATRAALDRIARIDGQLHAFLAVDAEGALSAAREVDARHARGEAMGALAGVPVAVKDALATKGLATTAGSRILEGFVPPVDATAVARLRAAGAIVVGKTNMDEFGMGSSTEHSAFGPTRNPWDVSRTPGGSSGGSAAAVAAGLAPIALGTDTGGSIRQPASLCGVVGIKPTYGRVSRSGVVAFASSLDQVGPFGGSCEDCAAVLDVIAGHDPADATTIPDQTVDHTFRIGRDPKGLRVGVPREYFGLGIDREVEAAVRAAIGALESLGMPVTEVSLPHTEHGLAVYYLVAPAEASANLARFDGVRYGRRVARAELDATYAATRSAGFGPEVKRRIMLGTYALSAGYHDAFYGRAQKVRTLLRRDFEDAFRTVDVLAAPVSPVAAFPLGERVEDPLAMYLGDVFTLPTSLAGLPGLSVPCGFTKAGLPIGLQLVGPALSEPVLFQIGHAYESLVRHARRPAVRA